MKYTNNTGDKDYSRKLYVFTIPSEENKIWTLGGKNRRFGVGRVKIGQTMGDVNSRVRACMAQGSSSPLSYNILFEADLPLKVTDKHIHKILRDMGCHQSKGTEWFECSVEEVIYAYELVKDNGLPRKMKYNEKILERMKNANYNKFVKQIDHIQNTMSNVEQTCTNIVNDKIARINRSYKKEMELVQSPQVTIPSIIVNNTDEIQKQGDVVLNVLNSIDKLKERAKEREKCLDISEEDVRILELLIALKLKDERESFEKKFFLFLNQVGQTSYNLTNCGFSIKSGVFYKVDSSVVTDFPALKEKYLREFPWEHINTTGTGDIKIR